MRQKIVGFGMAVASAGSYANNLHLTPDGYPHQHLIGQFLQAACSSWRPNQQCQSIEGKLSNELVTTV